jgi:hypothetical protein
MKNSKYFNPDTKVLNLKRKFDESENTANFKIPIIDVLSKDEAVGRSTTTWKAACLTHRSSGSSVSLSFPLDQESRHIFRTKDGKVQVHHQENLTRSHCDSRKSLPTSGLCMI